MTVRTRFAPSPTGYLHIGGARTALFNWLFARNREGKFILRIEDTDYSRSTEESVNKIIEELSWLGLNWDEGPFFQTDRMPIYSEKASFLLEKGLAYRCYCTKEELEEGRKRMLSEGKKPMYNRRCLFNPPKGRKEYVIRFLSPDEGNTSFDDIIKGHIEFNNLELDDLVLVRSDGVPTYNFTVVVDDSLMEITHVIRGDDHINNTPRQILIYRALGLPLPRFGHVPLILGPDKSRLSKRHGALSVGAYRDMGFLPDGLINYLVRLGWSHGDQEIFGKEELIDIFSLDSIGKSSGVFNSEKMLWVNQQHVKNASVEEVSRLALPFFRENGLDPSGHPRYAEAVGTLMERAKTLKELATSGLFYFRDGIEIEEESKRKFLIPGVVEPLSDLKEMLGETEPFDKESIQLCFDKVMGKYGLKLGKIAQPVRVALTGTRVSPGIFEVIHVLGKEVTLTRLESALEMITLDA